MKKLSWIAGGLFAAAGLLAGCPEDPPPPPPPVDTPPVEDKVIVPDYNPSGDHADLKKEAAAGIDMDNAEAKAGAIEKTLDDAIATLEGGAE